MYFTPLSLDAVFDLCFLGGLDGRPRDHVRVGSGGPACAGWTSDDRGNRKTDLGCERAGNPKARQFALRMAVRTPVGRLFIEAPRSVAGSQERSTWRLG